MKTFVDLLLGIAIGMLLIILIAEIIPEETQLWCRGYERGLLESCNERSEYRVFRIGDSTVVQIIIREE